MTDLTVILYTSNREDPAFEGKTRSLLAERIGDLPVISVSQRPIDFGDNICVGDIGVSDANVQVQLAAGCRAATTRFVATAEVDYLYPPRHFDFRPPEDGQIYRPQDFYILFKHGPFRAKGNAEGATFANRLHLLSLIEKGEYGARHVQPVKYQNELPVVVFKTSKGMHHRSPHDIHRGFHTLPYWGDAKALRKLYGVR